MYILGLYTFASVLIARIAIEQNRALAMGYMLAMGAAAMLVTMRFIQFPSGMQALAFPIVLGFLILIAVLADRITFDCTVIDDQEDSSGEGLLQSLGLLKSQLRTPKSLADNQKAQVAVPKKKKSRKHNPGVWVLYFALLAVPMFGIGQLFMTSNDSITRDRSFFFLAGYLLCALSLLVVTSFLNLRRYLRQRNVAMPTEMTLTWLASGIAGVVVLLLVAMVLPLPGRAYGLFGLPFKLTSGDLKASKWGWGPEGVQDNSVKASVPPQQSTPQANQQNQSSKSDRPKVAGGNDSQSGEQSAQSKANGQGQPSNESGGKEQGGQDSNNGNKSNPSNSSSSKNSGKQSESSKSKSSEGQGSKPDSSKSGSSQGKSQSQPKSDGQQPSNAEQSKDQQQAGSQESPSAKAQSPSDSGKQPNSNNSKQQPQNQPSSNQKQNQSQSPNQKDNSDQSANKQESDSSQKDGQENSPDQSDQSNSESSREQSDQNNDPSSSKENTDNSEQQQDQEKNASDQGRPENRDAAKDADLKKQSEEKNQSEKKKNAEQENTQSKSESSPSSSFFNSLPNLSSLVKIITALILAGIIFLYLLLQGRELLAALRGWFDRLFGSNDSADQSSKQSASSATESRDRKPSFSSFMNPFSKSISDGSQAEIVRYTFDAVEAWGNEHGAPRQAEETPEEYLKRLARQYPTQSTYLQSLGNLYYRIAYANRQIRIADIDPLRKLCAWLWAPKTSS
jgi:Domain of unknown function (DUF4129)